MLDLKTCAALAQAHEHIRQHRLRDGDMFYDIPSGEIKIAMRAAADYCGEMWPRSDRAWIWCPRLEDLLPAARAIAKGDLCLYLSAENRWGFADAFIDGSPVNDGYMGDDPEEAIAAWMLRPVLGGGSGA